MQDLYRLILVKSLQNKSPHNENRIRENFDLSFQIDYSDMKEISTMDKGDGIAWPNGDPCNSE